MFSAPYCKIIKIAPIVILSLFLLAFQIPFYKHEHECISVEDHRKALLQMQQQLHGSTENNTKVTQSLNITAVLVNYSNPPDLQDEGDHLRSYSYSFKEIFLDCLGSKYWNILNTIVFGKNVQVIPFDAQFADCILYKNGRLHAKPTVVRFGVIHLEKNSTFESLIKTSKNLCRRIVDEEFCLVLSCKNNITLHFVRLVDKIDYWIGENCLRHSNYVSNQFAIKKFNIQFVPANQTVVAYPLDTIRFQKHLTYSNLLKCNKTLETFVKAEYPSYYNVTPKLTEASFKSLVKLRDMLHGARMTPMLGSGTLLGWARECGIIPYTHDYDLMALFDEYNEQFEKMITESLDFYLAFRFNKLNDSLEYTLKDRKKFRFDIFFLYQEETHSWFGGMGYRKLKLKFTFPRLKQICSADFLGYLFHVPCNYIEFIVADFGSNWTTPIHQDNFISDKMSNAVSKIKKFTSEEYDDNFVRFK